jgi:ligand-binding sensor protein
MVVVINDGDDNNVGIESDEWDDDGDYLTMVEVMVMVVLMVLVVKWCT